MKTSIKILIGIIILAIIAIIFTLFNSTTGNVIQNSNTIKIGATMPLTGDLANFGIGEKNAMEIAVNEINSKGGVNGKKLEIVVEDTKCDAKEAVNVANQLINIEKVPVIVGEVCSGPTLAMAPLAEQSKTILFATAASSPKITNAGDFTFRDYPSDSYQGKYAAEYSYNKLGKRKAGVLYMQIDYGIGVKDSFEKRFKELGGQIVDEENFPQNVKDLRTQLTKIKDANPDVIYFVGYNEEAITFIQKSKELNINTQIVTTETFDDPSIIQKVGNSADGIIYVLLANTNDSNFKKAMKEKTGSDQILIGSPNVYDAVYIIANAMKNCKNPEDTVCIKQELYKVKNYPGVSGNITIDSNGDLASANYIIKQYKGKEAIEIN